MALLYAGLAMACLVASASGGALDAVVAPWITLYSEQDMQGENITFSDSVADVGAWSNRTSSYCCVGCWVTFLVANFSSQSRIRGLICAHERVCTSYDDGVLGSVREVGDPSDIYADALSLFSGDFYSDELTFVTDDAPSLSGGGQLLSAAVSGDHSWSVYPEENYGGNATCLEAGLDLSWVSLFDYTSLDVRSAHKGCSNASERLDRNGDADDVTLLSADGLIRQNKQSSWEFGLALEPEY